jgi:type II secretory pathway pseudopilin PulG
MHTAEPTPSRGQSGESGFTLVEALIAVIILVFGLVAVTNLFLMAISTNIIANGSTAATDAAAATIENLKNLPWNDAGLQPAACPAATPCTRFDDMPGVGRIQSSWVIENVDTRTRFITVTAEHLGAFSRGKSRAQFTTIRTCTTPDLGCP